MRSFGKTSVRMQWRVTEIRESCPCRLRAAILVGLLLAACAFGQYNPPSGGGGGGGTWGSITGTLASQSDLNTALGLKAPLASPSFTGTVAIGNTLPSKLVADTGTLYDYGSAIVDPSPLVVASTCSGTCGKPYSYAVVIFNGIGFTLPSADTSVFNAVTLNGSHFNTITLPNLADPNLSCIVVRTAGTTDKKYITSISNGSVCDGRTVVDSNPAGTDSTISLPGANTTKGILVGQVSGFSQNLDNGGPQQVTIGGVTTGNGVDYNFLNCCSDWKFLDQLGNQTMAWLPQLNNSGVTFRGYSATRTFEYINIQLKLSDLAGAGPLPLCIDASGVIYAGTNVATVLACP